jgi:two-component system NarL family sensor kinase
MNARDCFAVLVIDDVTGLKTPREVEKRLHVLSCQLIDAQEMERKKIAAELHDGIGQMMGAIKFQIEGLITAGTYDAGSCRFDQLRKCVENLRDAMDEVRRITMDLRPSTLDDLGLLLTIDWFCREFCNMYRGVRIAKKVTIEESNIIEERKIVIYRIIQEAMNNTAKYADATEIALELSDRDEGLYLCVRDNGRGFDINQIPGASCFHRLGLRSMRERAESSGGVFAIQSSPGRGTTVEVLWPQYREVFPFTL